MLGHGIRLMLSLEVRLVRPEIRRRSARATPHRCAPSPSHPCPPRDAAEGSSPTPGRHP